MIFCGDFVCPKEVEVETSFVGSPTFWAAKKIVNFEGSIVDSLGTKTSVPIPLKSHVSSLKILNELNVCAVTLANNHIFDYSGEIEKTLIKFEEHRIQCCGVGKNIEYAMKELVIDDFVVINFGWSVIGCPVAKAYKQGCNPLIYDHVISSCKNAVENHPQKKVVAVFHWNFEFERYPMPAHRELARKLAGYGMYAVVGHHSHIVQGYEYFGDMPVIYGLGNFYMPEHQCGSVFLKYPESAQIGLCVDLTDRKNIVCYHAHLCHGNIVNVTKGLPLKDSLSSQFSQFSGMSETEYYAFFKLNRTKSKLLPIYRHLNESTLFKDNFVRFRQFGIDSLVKLRLK